MRKVIATLKVYKGEKGWEAHWCVGEDCVAHGLGVTAACAIDDALASLKELGVELALGKEKKS